jgi:hypothetical protein
MENKEEMRSFSNAKYSENYMKRPILGFEEEFKDGDLMRRNRGTT